MFVLTCLRNLIAGVRNPNSDLNGRYNRFLTEFHIFPPFDLKFGMCVLTCLETKWLILGPEILLKWSLLTVLTVLPPF